MSNSREVVCFFCNRSFLFPLDLGMNACEICRHNIQGASKLYEQLYVGQVVLMIGDLAKTNKVSVEGRDAIYLDDLISHIQK